MTTEIAEMTLADMKRFGHLRRQVKSWMDNRFEAGKALAEIRDSKLYRDEFETFEDFCVEEYKFARAHAYRLIEFVEIKMSPIGDKIENEAQARAIAKVPKKKRKKVLLDAEKNGEITAASITEAAQSESQEAIELDGMGDEIPSAILPEWNRSREVASELVSKIQHICTTLKNGHESNDLIFREFSQSVVTQAEGLRYTIKAHLPAFALCFTCHGRKPENCDTCSQRGFVSKYFWDQDSKRQAKAKLARSK